MIRVKFICNVLWILALIVFLTGCASENDSLFEPPSSLERLTEPTMPEYPGGSEALFEFIANNYHWPDDDVCVMGCVVVTFIVEKDGSISDPKVVKGVHPLFDEEAVRVVKSMPKWKPGMWNGKPARVKYSVPFSLRLK